MIKSDTLRRKSQEASCPMCPEGTGDATAVALSEAGRRTQYCCQQCGARWTCLERWTESIVRRHVRPGY